ncbi:MAG TPA: MarR family transcriptional regulator [Flavobacteriaceae bacterium]|nr:MarR family transcriptional regulator [Flavobacteriaceae bacterium]
MSICNWHIFGLNNFHFLIGFKYIFISRYIANISNYLYIKIICTFVFQLIVMKKDKDLIDALIADWNIERPDLDVDAMQIVGRVMKLGKIFENRASLALKENGIYYTDLDVLATLRRSGKPYQLTPKQLMESVVITSGAMTALLNRLTKLELIYRAADENDGRISLAGLTEKGKKIIDEAIKKRFDEAKNSIQILNKKEQEDLSILLKKLLIELDQ